MLSAMLRWLRKTGEDRSQPATDHAFFFRSSLPPTGGLHGQPYGQGQALSLARVPGEPRPLHTAPRPLGGDPPVASTPCGWPWGPTDGSGNPLAPSPELGLFGPHSYVVTRRGNLLTPPPHGGSCNGLFHPQPFPQNTNYVFEVAQASQPRFRRSNDPFLYRPTAGLVSEQLSSVELYDHLLRSRMYSFQGKKENTQRLPAKTPPGDVAIILQWFRALEEALSAKLVERSKRTADFRHVRWSWSRMPLTHLTNRVLHELIRTTDDFNKLSRKSKFPADTIGQHGRTDFSLNDLIMADGVRKSVSDYGRIYTFLALYYTFAPNFVSSRANHSDQLIQKIATGKTVDDIDPEDDGNFLRSNPALAPPPRPISAALAQSIRRSREIDHLSTLSGRHTLTRNRAREMQALPDPVPTEPDAPEPFVMLDAGNPQGRDIIPQNDPENLGTADNDGILTTCLYMAADGESNQPGQMLTYRNEKAALRALLMFILGDNSDVCNVAARHPSKGGVRHISHVIAPEFYGPLEETLDVGFAIMVDRVPQPHKAAFIDGDTWVSLDDYVQKLYKERKCMCNVPAATAIRSLVQEVIHNKQVIPYSLHPTLPYLTCIKASLSNLASALESAVHRLIKNWANETVDGTKGKGVPVKFHADDADRFADQDVYGPAIAQVILGLVSAAVSDTDWIKANRELSLRLSKSQFEITAAESLSNKVGTLFSFTESANPHRKIDLFNKLDTITGREGHFDLDEFNHEAARKITQISLREDGTLKPSSSRVRQTDMEHGGIENAAPLPSEDEGDSYDNVDRDGTPPDLDINHTRGDQRKPRRQDGRNDRTKSSTRPAANLPPRHPAKGNGRDRPKHAGDTRRSDDRGKYSKNDRNRPTKRTSFGDRSRDPYVKQKKDSYTSKPRARTRNMQLDEETVRAVLATLQIQQSVEDDDHPESDGHPESDQPDSIEPIDGQYSNFPPIANLATRSISNHVFQTKPSTPRTCPTTSSRTIPTKYKGTVPELKWIKPTAPEPRPALSDQKVFARGNSPTFVLNPDCLKNKYKHVTYHVIIDSGATHTVIPQDLTEHIDEKCVTGLRFNPFVNNKDASGNPMTMGEDAYDLTIGIKEDLNVSLDLLGAVVLKSGSKHVKRQILLGISDMRIPNYISLLHTKDCPDKTQVQFNDRIVPYNKVCFDLAKNKFRRAQNSHERQDINIDRENDFDEFPNIDFGYPEPPKTVNQAGSLEKAKSELDRDSSCYIELTRWDHGWFAHLDRRQQQLARRHLQHGLESNGIRTNDQHRRWKLEIPRSWNGGSTPTASETGCGLILLGSTEAKVNAPTCPDSRYHTMIKIERIRNNKLNTFTHEEIKIDPLDEVLKNDPLRELKIAVLRKIVRRHKKVFRADTGCVTTNNYEVHAEIDLRNSNISPNKVPCYQARADPKFVKAVCDKLNEEYADGVIEQNVNGRIVLKHIMPIFSVAKKTDTTVKVEAIAEASNIRLIADCSREINGATVHKGRQGDDIREITRDVAGFTKKGFMFSIDISNCFHCIRLHKDLYPYFGVQHPELGDCYYTRLPQGWISSPAFCKDFLMNILGKYRKNLCRYADDIMGGADTWEEFIELFEGVLATLEYNNLRLKGKKVQLLGCSIEFLGRRIEHGVIKASPHHVQRLNDFSYEALSTKGLLKQFIGLCTYLSEFRYMANEALNKVRELSNGPNKDKIDWTAENIEAFNKAKTDMNNLITLHTMDPDLQTFLVTDTSRLATGAVLYQQYVDENGLSSRRYIGLFSKKRIGLTNVHQIPSCVLELSGIAAAATHFRPYLERLSKKLIILTDSLGAVRAYKKYQATGVPSSNMRVSSFLAAMWGHNFDMHHVSSDSEEIKAVDFISRFKNEKHTPECDENTCAVCKKVEFIQGTSRSRENDLVLLNHELVANTNRIAKYFNKLRYEDHWCIDMEPDDFLHTMTVCPDKVPRVMRQYSQDAYWKSPNILINQVRTRRERCPPHTEFIGPLSDLIANTKMLRSMQDSDSTLRKAREIIRGRVKGKDPPTNKQTQLRTMIHSKRCYIDARGLIVMDKITKRDKISRLSTVVLLPEYYGPSVIKCIHHSYGDSTLSQMLLKVDQHFHLPLIKAKAEEFINKCPGCILLKRRVSPRKWSYKEAPMPTKFGEVILCDEIHRQDRDGNKQRFMFATDCLSRFSKLYPIEKTTTAQDFKNIVQKVLRDFARPELKGNKIVIRADGCKTHACAQRDSRFCRENNVEINIHEKHTPLSVGIPELDGRMQKLSPILSMHLLQPNKSMHNVARDAAHDYNVRQGYECYSPRELWTGRLDDSNKKFDVPLEELIETIKSVRKSHRDRFDAILHDKHRLNKIHIIKHGEKTPYGNADRMPIKIGDLIVLSAKWDKNDRNRFMKICPDERNQAINWDERLVHVRRLGVQERSDNGKLVAFDAINWVIDGNSPEALEFAEKVNRTRKNAKGAVKLWSARTNLINRLINTRSAGRQSRPPCLEATRANPFYDQKTAIMDMEDQCPVYDHEVYWFDDL